MRIWAARLGERNQAEGEEASIKHDARERLSAITMDPKPQLIARLMHANGGTHATRHSIEAMFHLHFRTSRGVSHPSGPANNNKTGIVAVGGSLAEGEKKKERISEDSTVHSPAPVSRRSISM